MEIIICDQNISRERLTEKIMETKLNKTIQSIDQSYLPSAGVADFVEWCY